MYNVFTEQNVNFKKEKEKKALIQKAIKRMRYNLDTIKLSIFRFRV